MPGYYVHLASSNPLARKSRSFVCGVEAPDLLKTYFKSYGLVGAKKKYDAIKTNEMPDFSSFRCRLQQEEQNGIPEGMHYGWSSSPDIFCYWNSLTLEQKKNPFYIGYLWHLLTDLLLYTYLDIDAKFVEFNAKHSNDKNLQFLVEQEVKKLHTDWDITNAKIRDTYGDVLIPPEIRELGIVKFINCNRTSYVDWDVMKSIIDYMRSFNPLMENLEEVIPTVMRALPDSKACITQNELDEKLTLSRTLHIKKKNE